MSDSLKKSSEITFSPSIDRADKWVLRDEEELKVSHVTPSFHKVDIFGE
jgi:hypothetical protein